MTEKKPSMPKSVQTWIGVAAFATFVGWAVWHGVVGPRVIAPARGIDTDPILIRFGATAEQLDIRFRAQCEDVDRHETDSDTASSTDMDIMASVPAMDDHQQIDCVGFPYFGKARLAEFHFSDQGLSLVVIRTEEGEEEQLIAALSRQHGVPALDNNAITAFPAANLAVAKNDPSVLVFAPAIADEVLALYRGAE